MCLVSGYSGSGKSKLIEELIKLPNMNLTIGYGKFDQFNRTTPYFAFIQ
jgi:predicted ATPase